MLEVQTRAARSSARWTAPASIDAVRERLLDEITQSTRARVTSSTQDVIQASVQGNAFSWGERIAVQLTPTTGGTNVAVETRPMAPFTLFDWGEGERDIRLLHAAVPATDDGGLHQHQVHGRPPRLGRTSRLSKPLGWSIVVVAVLAVVLALVDLVVDTANVSSWLPLLVIMSVVLVVVVRDLRRG